jgi:hypothetical protein
MLKKEKMVMLLQEKTNKMKIIKIILKILTCVILSLQGCVSQEKKIACIKDILKTEKNQELVASLKDSIYSWSSRDMKGMSYYAQDKSSWVIDALIKNSNSDKLFGWILQVDNDESKDALDYIKFFSGEKRDGQWFFYLHNMPKIWMDRNNNKYSFDQLSEIAKSEVVRGGLVKRNCNISDEYIEEWIEREGRNMYEWHQDFLQSSSPTGEDLQSVPQK